MIAASPPDRDTSAPRAPLRVLRGSVAFITGGSSGIGLGIARACSAEGMKVVVTYLTERHFERARAFFEATDHAGFLGLRVDVTDRHAMARAADAAEDAFGNVHLLCNNAGVGVPTRITEATYEDWDFAMSVNVGGVISGLQTFLRRILSHGEPAHVLATASMSGIFHGGSTGIYTTTKFALVGMMEALRAELAPMGVGVSVICPGLVATNIFHATRNRPAVYAVTGRDVEASDRYRAFMAAGMDAYECGKKVLRGVRRNDMYIFTHPEFEQGIRDRCDAIAASIPRGDGPVPPERLRAEEKTLRHPVYLAETERLASPSQADRPTRTET